MAQQGATGPVVVLTTTKVEYDAVRVHLAGLQRHQARSGFWFESGFLPWSSQAVILKRINADDDVREIEGFTPKAVVFVTVADSLGESVAAGDVVVATGVMIGTVTYAAPRELLYEADEIAERERSKETPFTVRFKTIMIGETARISGDPKPVAVVEMGGTGVMAADLIRTLPTLTVSGVVERATRDRASARAAQVRRAAANAARFALAIVAWPVPFPAAFARDGYFGLDIAYSESEFTDDPFSATSDTVRIYLSDERDHGRVEQEVEAWLSGAEVQVLYREPPVSGSWFRTLLVRAHAVARDRPVGGWAATAERAVELRMYKITDAQVTATLMQSVAPVLASLQNTDDAVIRAGSILIVKVDGKPTVTELSATQQLYLDRHPEMLTTPTQLLWLLKPEEAGTGAPDGQPRALGE